MNVNAPADRETTFEVLRPALVEAAPALLGRLLGRGGGYADVFFEQTVHHRHTLRQKFARGRFQAPAETASRHVVEGTGLRVLAGADEAHAAVPGFDRLVLDEAAASLAARLPDGGAPPPLPPWDAPPPEPAPPDLPDGLAASEKQAVLREAADAAFALDAGVVQVDVEYQDRTRRVVVATSEGRLVEQIVPLVGLRVEVTLVDHGRTVRAHAVAGGREGFGYFFGHAPAHVARRAVERAVRRCGATPDAAPLGAMPVVIAGGWGGVWLHEAVGHLLEADVAGAPVDRLGHQVAAPFVTIVDDGRRPGGRGTSAFDDEGTATAATTLVDAGVLRALLTDRRHAARLGLPLTGNARRQDYRHAPLPRMTNFCLRPGPDAPDALIAGARDGFYVTDIGHGRVVPADDAFSFDVLEGYRIEGGRCTHLVTGVEVHGRLSDVLAHVVGVADDATLETGRGLCRKAGQVVPISVGMPTVLLSALDVRPRREVAA